MIKDNEFVIYLYFLDKQYNCHRIVRKNKRSWTLVTCLLGSVCLPEDEPGGESRAAHADRWFLLAVCGGLRVGYRSDRHRWEEQGAQRQNLPVPDQRTGSDRGQVRSGSAGRKCWLTNGWLVVLLFLQDCDPVPRPAASPGGEERNRHELPVKKSLF